MYGDVALGHINKTITLRQTLAPYIKAELARTSATGLPFNRPLWFDFPDDPNCWKIGRHLGGQTMNSLAMQYMVGSEMMAAPVTQANVSTATVYLPSNNLRWRHYFSGEEYAGGMNHSIPTPLDSFPLFSIVR